MLGGPPECPTRPYCQIGLSKTYGLHFKSFKPLDAGGPLTVAALKSGSIQVGLLFTTSGAIVGNGWVLLKDDKHLQPADNVTPVLNNKIITAYGADSKTLVDGVSAKITTEVLTDLNKQTDIDQKDPDAVAKAGSPDQRFAPGDDRPRRPARPSSSARRTSPRTRRSPTSTPTCSRPTATR